MKATVSELAPQVCRWDAVLLSFVGLLLSDVGAVRRQSVFTTMRTRIARPNPDGALDVAFIPTSLRPGEQKR